MREPVSADIHHGVSMAMLVCRRRVCAPWARVPPPAMAPAASASRCKLAPAALHGSRVLYPMRPCGQVVTRSIAVTSSVSFGLLDGLPLSDNHASYGVYRVAWTKQEGVANTQGRWAVFTQVPKSERASQIKLGRVSDERGSLLGTFSDLQDAIHVSNKFRQLTKDDQKMAMKHLYNSEADDLLRMGVWRASVGIDAPTPMEFEVDELTLSERERYYLTKEPVRNRMNSKTVHKEHRVYLGRTKTGQEQSKRHRTANSARTQGTPNNDDMDQTQTDQEKAGQDENETGWFS